MTSFIPITITPTKDILAESGVERVDFESLGLTEAKIEEFLRKNIRLLFEDEDDETLLIVGQQVVNLKGARNDLVALDGNGNLVLVEIKRDASDMAARTEAMEFQAIRYAASLATITTADDLVERVFTPFPRDGCGCALREARKVGPRGHRRIDGRRSRV